VTDWAGWLWPLVAVCATVVLLSIEPIAASTRTRLPSWLASEPYKRAAEPQVPLRIENIAVADFPKNMEPLNVVGRKTIPLVGRQRWSDSGGSKIRILGNASRNHDGIRVARIGDVTVLRLIEWQPIGLWKGIIQYLRATEYLESRRRRNSGIIDDEINGGWETIFNFKILWLSEQIRAQLADFSISGDGQLFGAVAPQKDSYASIDRYCYHGEKRYQVFCFVAEIGLLAALLL